jgi:hypothetical protein
MKKYNIPPSMFVTFDETSSSLIPADDWTLEEEGATQVPIAGLDDKRNVTLGLSFSGAKQLLDSQIIYEGKTDRCHADYDFPSHLRPTHSESHWSTENTNIEYIDGILHEHMQAQRAALHRPPTQYGLLSWDVFKSHCTRRVLDLLEARRIKVVFVPANCTSISSANDHPEFNKNVKVCNKNKFTLFYSEKVAESLANGEDEVFVQFPAAEMKPLHAKWTAETLAYVATQEQWMENALRGVGTWDIMTGDFVPDPAYENEYFVPPIATAEEAAADRPDTESEYEFASQSEQEAESGDEAEEEVEYNLEDEVESDNEEPHTPVFNSPARCANDDGLESDEEPLHQPLRKRRTLVADSEDDDQPPPNAKEDYPERESIPQTPVSRITTPARQSRTSRNARIAEVEQEEMQQAIVESLLSLSQHTTGETLDPEDGEYVLEEETRNFHLKMVQQGQWRVNYLNEAWQLAKRCLFQPKDLPKRIPKHPTQLSLIVAMNVAPKKIVKIVGDGSCLFRALSFGLFRTEDAHRVVREEVLKHMSLVWDHQPRIRLLASMWYQDKTKKQLHIKPKDLVLTAQQYIQSVRMDMPTTWGGSTELEAAAQWLNTVIKVYYYGNPKYPPSSWISYGTHTAPFNSHTMLLIWTNNDHYDYVAELF